MCSFWIVSLMNQSFSAMSGDETVTSTTTLLREWRTRWWCYIISCKSRRAGTQPSQELRFDNTRRGGRWCHRPWQFSYFDRVHPSIPGSCLLRLLLWLMQTAKCGLSILACQIVIAFGAQNWIMWFRPSCRMRPQRLTATCCASSSFSWMRLIPSW